MTTPPPPAPRLLVVDDEPDIRTVYELTLLRAGYQVVTVDDLTSARQCLATQNFDAIITDMRLPDGMGLDLVLDVAQRSEKVIVITAYGSAENAVEALKAGAFDYLTKPVDLKQFRNAVAAALRSARPATPPAAALPPGPTAPAVRAPQPPPTPLAEEALARIVGPSALMDTVRQRIARVARSMAPVLVLGESGTGKELVARALHACSHRADGPFVAVNCGAIPESLIEAEFFGVRKGAYTGANQDRIGYFQTAQGGTLFLDEIGDLPLPMQAKLLRAIQERQIRPLGSAQEESIDVRFVSATHRDLAQAVKAQQFRQDLYYRLNVIELRLPPLRERRQDLPALVHSLLQRLCEETDHTQPTLSPAALTWLNEQTLPGNVRELENILHRGLALSQSDILDVDDLAEPLTGWGAPLERPEPLHMPRPHSPAAPTTTSSTGKDALLTLMDRSEHALLTQTLSQCQWDLPRTAQTLGLTPRQLTHRLKRLGIAQA